VDVAGVNVSRNLFTGSINGNGLPVVPFYIWPQRKKGKRDGLPHSGRYS